MRLFGYVCEICPVELVKVALRMLKVLIIFERSIFVVKGDMTQFPEMNVYFQFFTKKSITIVNPFYNLLRDDTSL